VRTLVGESPVDSAPADEPAPIELAATLIGGGGTGIAAGQAAQLIAQGVRDANDRLHAAPSPAGRRWPQVSRLRLVELYLDRAAEAWNALKLQASATPGRYELDPVIQRGTGPLLRPLDSGYRGANYDFITATTRTTDKKEVEIEYALDTKRARTEIRALTPQSRLLRDLVASASSDANTDKQIGRTLFQLLVPVDIEPFLADSIDMQIALDPGTAGIPWELLDDTGGDAKREPWAIRCKLLRKLELRNYRPNARDADRDGYGLVIGEPECPADYGPLPGARKEARVVVERLSKNGALRDVIRLIGDDGSPGPDARTVVDTLFERDWRVVHIAGHGALPEDGSNGGVVLSNGTFIGPAEIRAMRVVPELVFVNCCHLGGSPTESVLADGRADPSRYDRAKFASSVAGELIAIGVRCVIAAGWAVGDDPAEAFASIFYRRLLEGARFIDAVADARRAARVFDGNTWAAYQCYGDPDWRLVRVAKVSPKPTKEEFEGVASVAALKLALETLRVQKTYQGYESAYQRVRVANLEERWREAKWSASDGVAERFAGVYAAVGDLDKAIEWYDRAIDAADGDVSLRALEQRANLQVRRAWSALGSLGKTARSSGAKRSKALEAARKTIGDGVEMLTELMKLRPTAERANLCGSAMKRLALVEAAAGRSREEVHAIEEMKRHYKRGADLCAKDKLPDFFYPASNYIAAELVLHAGKKGWKLGEHALFDATRKSLADKNRGDPDFWSIVGEIDIDLYAAVAEGELAKEWSEHLDKRYDDLYTRMRGGSEWASVYDTAAFVLGKYRERAAPPERRAADAVLAKLKKFAPTDGRKPRRKG
jgi:tetratricopeptide (TPR) repeat protein